jgi:hypothetical protein
MGTYQGRKLVELMRDRWHRLDSIYSSWRTQYQEISRNYLPWTGQFWAEQRNEGWKRNDDILDNSPERAVRVLAAGLTAGASSPARPWFKIAAQNRTLDYRHDLQLWCDEVTHIIMRAFSQSNVYRGLQQLYTECPLYGTAAAILEPDPETGVHLRVLTAGQYRIASNPKGQVATLYREFQMSVSQLVREFGLEKCSDRVKSLYREGNLEEGITVLHAIEPRTDREPGAQDNRNMPWRSVYWESGEQPDVVREVLRESGFNRFPCLVPRWSVLPGDDYGSGPGMTALGDVIQLQQEQFRKSQMIDFASDPSMLLPNDMKNQEVDLAPGGKNYTDATGANRAGPLWQPGQQLQPLLMDIQDVRQRIQSAWFADMFLMIAQTDKTMTATEVAERHEEKLLMLGPALERLHNELLDPLVTMTFHYLNEAGMIPPPPDDVGGEALDVEFISMLAQTQRAVGARTIDRFLATTTAVAQAKPEILDRIDADEFVEDLAQRLGVPSRILVSRKDADELRKARAEMEAEQAKAAMMQQQATTAKDLASASSMAPAPPEQQFSSIAGS